MIELLADSTVALRALDHASEFFSGVPHLVLLFAHSAFCATLAPDVKDRYLMHYWLTFTAGFGGGAVSALILTRHDDVHVNFFVGWTDVVWTLTWWLVNYFPFNVPGYFFNWKPVKMVTKMCVNILRSRTICARVTQTALFYPLAYFAPMVMGTMGGSGGKFLHDMMRGGYGISTSKDELSLPSMSYHSTVFVCAIYYMLVHIMDVLTAVQGTTLVTIILVLHGLVVDVAGVDIIRPFFRLFHLITNIPQPALSDSHTKKTPVKSDDQKKKE